MSCARLARVVVWCSLAVCSACGGAAQGKPDDALDVAGNVGDIRNVSGSAKPPAGRGRAPSARENQVIAELMRAAERVRGLRFEHDVPVVVEDRDRITAYVESQIEDDELERERTLYIALGLLSPTLDVRALLLRVMGEQVVGYYDPEGGRLVVRDDVMEAFARASSDDEQSDLVEARTVLVHELVHALQAQNLGLAEHIDDERSIDAENAFHALVEGDATLAMYGYALEREQIPLHKVTSNPAMVRSFSEAVRSSPLTGSELEQAPPIVRLPLLSAYVDGLSFCASLHGIAGWAGVDRAHVAPPVSTEQVLHPERYANPDVPERITLPALPAIESTGLSPLREETIGELELSVYFGQGCSDEDAQRAADGWDGDRLRVYTGSDRDPAVVWATVWDSDHDAEEAARCAERVRAAGSAASRKRAEVTRHGKSVLIVRDLPDAARASVLEAFSRGEIGPTAAP